MMMMMMMMMTINCNWVVTWWQWSLEGYMRSM